MPTIESTLAFRRFRSKNGELSKQYWFHLLNSEIAVEFSKSLNSNQYIVDQVKASFKNGMFPFTVAEYIKDSDEYMNRIRLQLLLVCSANLESYLHEITFAFLASKEYATTPIELNEIGNAIGSPILAKASIPEPLKYAEKLFSVDLGQSRKDWIHFYKLRCVVAHSGGVMTPRSKKDIPTLKTQIHEHIGIDWKELLKALKAADSIVTKIDEKIRSKELKLAEIKKELFYLKSIGKLPSHDDVWEYLHKIYGLTRTKSLYRKVILKEIYGISI